jgi:hypothetical protein
MSGQLGRSDMFIVPAPQQNRLMPHRLCGMRPLGAGES